MDLPRPDVARKKRRQRFILIGTGLALVVLITIGLSKPKPALPSVEKGSLLFEAVKRGELLRQVRGNGSLVPEDIRWIPTLDAGRVEQILIWPGARLKSDSVLVKLRCQAHIVDICSKLNLRLSIVECPPFALH